MIKGKFAIAIHGGAGPMSPETFSKAELEAYFAVLKNAVESAHQKLAQGESAVTACADAVKILEDSPLFNAGKGAVFNRQSQIQHNASIMDGKSKLAGAITCSTRIKNPILAALKVLQELPHVGLAENHANEFAERMGLEMVDPEYFYTDKRWEQHLKAKKQNRMSLDHDDDSSMGTVGAVALDQAGNLAAATSTGGMNFQYAGRVSDSSLIGAGTYANNATCAVSGTGTGDYFIRTVLCYDISARMEYGGEKLELACQQSLQRLKALGGEGGVIAIDSQGRLALPYVSKAMFRAWRDVDGQGQERLF